ncbi:MAG: glycine zipper 2TM domain-containing protein [Burkholderiaceae bacterium]
MKTASRFALIPLAAGLIGMSFSGLAQARDERARVISSTPVVEQVQVPRDVCQDQVVSVPGRSTGAGAIMGGIAGGAMGNAIGHGNGRAIATVIGLVGGAVIGDRIEGRPAASTQVVRQCSTQHVWEPRTVAYDVVYEYAGRRYQTQMAEEPGRWIPVSVSPVGAAPSPARTVVAPVYQAPAPTLVQVDVDTSRSNGPGWHHRPNNRHWQPYGY